MRGSSSAQAAPSLSARYRAMFNKRGNDWWSIVFGYPIARAFVLPLLARPAITPNLLTLASFVCKCMAAAAIAHSPGRVVAIALALQLSTIFDSMDGTLARARGSYSRVGAFLDKTTDAIGLFAILSAVGYQAAAQTGAPGWAVLGCTGGAAYLALCYMHWLARALREPKMTPSETAGLAEVPSWGDIARAWLAGWRRMFRFQEADLYFWIALFTIIGRFDVLAALIASSQVIGVVIRLATHARTLASADRQE